MKNLVIILVLTCVVSGCKGKTESTHPVQTTIERILLFDIPDEFGDYSGLKELKLIGLSPNDSEFYNLSVINHPDAGMAIAFTGHNEVSDSGLSIIEWEIVVKDSDNETMNFELNGRCLLFENAEKLISVMKKEKPFRIKFNSKPEGMSIIMTYDCEGFNEKFAEL